MCECCLGQADDSTIVLDPVVYGTTGAWAINLWMRVGNASGAAFQYLYSHAASKYYATGWESDQVPVQSLVPKLICLDCSVAWPCKLGSGCQWACNKVASRPQHLRSSSISHKVWHARTSMQGLVLKSEVLRWVVLCRPAQLWYRCSQQCLRPERASCVPGTLLPVTSPLTTNHVHKGCSELLARRSGCSTRRRAILPSASSAPSSRTRPTTRRGPAQPLSWTPTTRCAHLRPLPSCVRLWTCRQCPSPVCLRSHHWTQGITMA